MSHHPLIVHPRANPLIERLAKGLPQCTIVQGPVGCGVSFVAKYLAKSMGSPELIILPKRLVKGSYELDLENGRILIEDIRRLYEATRTTQPGIHVYIIDTSIGDMTHSSQNALLKMLEEPREGLHFIIATHRLESLLTTVKSRCHLLSLPPITDEQTKAYIQSLDIDDVSKRKRLEFIGNGKPALLYRLAHDSSMYDSRVMIMQDAKTMLAGSLYEKIQTINKYRDDRPGALTLVEDMCHQIKTVMLSQPSHRLSLNLEKYIQVRSMVSKGGSIKIQLVAAVI